MDNKCSEETNTENIYARPVGTGHRYFINSCREDNSFNQRAKSRDVSTSSVTIYRGAVS